MIKVGDTLPSATLQEYGITPQIEPDAFTIPALAAAIVDFYETAFADPQPERCLLQHYEEVNAEHGRIDKRSYYLSTCLDTLPTPAAWKKLASIGLVKSRGGEQAAGQGSRRHPARLRQGRRSTTEVTPRLTRPAGQHRIAGCPSRRPCRT